MNNTKNAYGFTVVELLMVIVVIGVLAAIVLVTYNSVQARAKDSSASAAVAQILKKIEAFNAEKGTYPVISTDLTGAAAKGYTYYVTGIPFVAAMGTTAPTNPQSVSFYKCGTGTTTTAPTTVAGITTTTGIRIDYFKHTSSTTGSLSTGTTSGAINGYNIGCVINN